MRKREVKRLTDQKLLPYVMKQSYRVTRFLSK